MAQCHQLTDHVHTLGRLAFGIDLDQLIPFAAHPFGGNPQASHVEIFEC